MALQLLRNAAVQLVDFQHGITERSTHTSKAHIRATVDGREITRSIGVITAAPIEPQVQALIDRLNNGFFFFNDSQLLDFRYNDYQGIVQDDSYIDNMIKYVGSEVYGHNIRSKPHSLKKVDFGIGDGGLFNVNTVFGWNPFRHFVDVGFQMKRLICLNGAEITSLTTSNKLIIANNFKEHLNIASASIHAKAERLLSGRLIEMTKRQGSIRDYQAVREYVTNMLNNQNLTTQQREICIGSLRLLNEGNMEEVYSSKAMENRTFKGVLPCHMTEYALWNMVTEVSTHVEQPNKQVGILAGSGLQNNILDLKRTKANKFERIGSTAIKHVEAIATDPNIPFLYDLVAA